MTVLIIFVVAWFIVGIVIAYRKLRQLQRIGFDRKLQLSALPPFVLGVVLWPLMLLLFRKEQESRGYGVSRINDYFVNAIHAWIWGMHGEAKIVALAAAKVANIEQRKSMIAHLSRMFSELRLGFSKDPTMQRHSRRLRTLIEEIEARDWNTADAAEEMQRLNECNPHLLEALKKSDPDIFVQIYPILFSKTFGKAVVEANKRLDERLRQMIGGKNEQ